MAPLGGTQQQGNNQSGSTAVQQQQRQLQFTQREVRQDDNRSPGNSGNNVNNASVVNQQSSSGNGSQGQPNQQQPNQPQYSIPGILHFLQFEWQRFEVERQQWNVERAELQARIALLQGERKGQDNLKNDLVRRIKMLEYCLKQERIKFHRLKFGTDPPGMETTDADQVDNQDNEADNPLAGLVLSNNNNNLDDSTAGLNWKHGRQLLRQYLQEIGYTDTIIDVRSNRVRSLLGLNNNMNANNAVNSALGLDISSIDGNKPGIKTTAQTVRRGNSNAASASSILGDTEASVLATFDFLHEQRDGHSRDDDDEDDEEDIGDDQAVSGSSGNYNIDSETEEVLAEFDFLNTQSSQQQSANVKHHQIQQQQQDVNWRSRIPDIGELANLTLNNESDMNGLNSSTGLASSSAVTAVDYRKTWNPKYILKSHFDCIRSLRFHRQEPLLITCSEDETLKLWNLNKTQTTSTKSGKSSTPSSQQQQSQVNPTTFDLEPVHTFRGHNSRVLTLTLEENLIFSGSQNGELFSWRLPENMVNIDPYDTFDVSMTPGSFVGHTDAVWSLVTQNSIKSSSLLLVSVSADSTLRVWEVSSRNCLKTIYFKDPQVKPTCVSCIMPSNSCSLASSGGSSLVVVSFTDGSMKVFDIENESVDSVLSFETSSPTETASRINSVVVHPAMPVVVSAHEDRQIKFWDLNNGKCVHSMVAHLDEVTCLAVDPTGLFLLSGSHDCSVRLWNFENRTCVQEITSHRKKFDEAIFDVTFHPQKSFFASAGADGLAKVFV